MPEEYLERDYGVIVLGKPLFVFVFLLILNIWILYILLQKEMMIFFLYKIPNISHIDVAHIRFISYFCTILFLNSM